MPIYEYKCEKCGATFEILQKVNSPVQKKCILCGGSVKKTLSPPALQFKGSGWYITDYTRKTRQKKPKTEKHKPEEKKSKTREENKKMASSSGSEES